RGSPSRRMNPAPAIDAVRGAVGLDHKTDTVASRASQSVRVFGLGNKFRDRPQATDSEGRTHPCLLPNSSNGFSEVPIDECIEDEQHDLEEDAARQVQRREF